MDVFNEKPWFQPAGRDSLRWSEIAWCWQGSCHKSPEAQTWTWSSEWRILQGQPSIDLRPYRSVTSCISSSGITLKVLKTLWSNASSQDLRILLLFDLSEYLMLKLKLSKRYIYLCQSIRKSPKPRDRSILSQIFKKHSTFVLVAGKPNIILKCFIDGLFLLISNTSLILGSSFSGTEPPSMGNGRQTNQTQQQLHIWRQDWNG